MNITQAIENALATSPHDAPGIRRAQSDLRKALGPITGLVRAANRIEATCDNHVAFGVMPEDTEALRDLQRALAACRDIYTAGQL